MYEAVSNPELQALLLKLKAAENLIAVSRSSEDYDGLSKGMADEQEVRGEIAALMLEIGGDRAAG